MDRGQCLPDRQQGCLCRSPFELVRFGEQNMCRQSGDMAPAKDLQVKFLHGVPYIHQQDDTGEGLPGLEIAADMALPVVLDLPGYLCKSIAREVDQSAPLINSKEIDLPGASGRLAGTGQ